MIIRLAGGDARRALTYLEAAAAGGAGAGPPTVTWPTAVEQAVDKAALRYDRDGDQHYDVISAFIKSVRGSDVQAALHYLARMVEAGEDPRFIARRLVILASEDIGLADPTSLHPAVAAADAVPVHRDARGPDQPGPGGDRTWPLPRSRNAVVLAIDGATATYAPAGPGRCRHTCGTRTTRRDDDRPREGLPLPARRARAGWPRSSTARRGAGPDYYRPDPPRGRGRPGRADAPARRAAGPRGLDRSDRRSPSGGRA